MIITANWKMNKTVVETAYFCESIREYEKHFNGVEVVICPPHTAISAMFTLLQGSVIKIGAQNMHWEWNGAYTGEIAAPMLTELGVKYVITGHSERRQLMGEDDSQVQRKMKAVLENGLHPILCVGETETERESGATATVIERQLRSALGGLTFSQDYSLVVAYEPVWAIGTGKAASPADAESSALLIRKVIRSAAGGAVAKNLRVQYGGSVNVENIGSFVTLPSINGALIGGASLDADTFNAMIQAARKAAGF